MMQVSCHGGSPLYRGTTRSSANRRESLSLGPRTLRPSILLQRALHPSFFLFFLFSFFPLHPYVYTSYNERTTHVAPLFTGRRLFLRDGHRNRSPTCCEIYTLNVGRNNDPLPFPFLHGRFVLSFRARPLFASKRESALPSN